MTRPPSRPRFGGFSAAARWRSVRHALAGVGIMLGTQHNAWIHLLATVGVLAAGWAFGVEREEWAWLVLAILAVWTAEGLNTALEILADAAVAEHHPLVRRAKDVAAGAVLIAAAGAVAIGALVFGPRLAAFAAGH